MTRTQPKVAFVNPPSQPLQDLYGKTGIQINMPMGLLYLATSLKQSGAAENTWFIDYGANAQRLRDFETLDEAIVQIANEAIDVEPDILAFTLMFSTSYSFVMETVKTLRKIWPNAVTILGGAYATNRVDTLLENVNIDYVARGEGEIAFPEFVRNFNRSGTIDVKGIISSEKVGRGIVHESCEMPQDLDEIDFPDWDLVDMNVYTSSRASHKRNIGEPADTRLGFIVTNRGCPFSCTFCASHTVHGRAMRYRSANNVTAEMKLLHERYGVSAFIPEDDMFVIRKDRSLELLQEMRNLNIPNMELDCANGLSVNALDEEIIDSLVDTGVKVMSIAIESGSEYVQRHIIKKRCDLNKAKRLVAYAKTKGLIVRCFFIVGYPGETREQMQETIDFSRDLQADWILFHIAVPLPGAEIFDQFVSMGAIDSSDASGITGYFERVFDTPEISSENLKDLAYRANIEINFLRNYNKLEGNFEKAIDIYEDILSMYPFHVVGHYCVMECHEGLGNTDEATRKRDEIESLVMNDSQALEMFLKFRDLMPGLDNIDVQANSSTDPDSRISGMGNEQAARRVRKNAGTGLMGKGSTRPRTAAV